MSLISDHYHTVSANYDEHFAELYNEFFQSVIKQVDFDPEHVIADVGSGTGCLAEKLFKVAKLNNPIVCVEPSEKMHLKAKEREGVFPVLKTGEDFFNDVSVYGCFDRVLMIQADHHFSDPMKIFKGVEKSLRDNGICAIVNLKGHSCYSLFSEATGAIMYPSDRHEETCRMLKAANFEVEMSWFEGKHDLKKAKFYSMLRGRFITNLYSMSDNQIEEGIEKLEQGELGLIKDDGLIQNHVRCVVLVAKKLPKSNNNFINNKNGLLA